MHFLAHDGIANGPVLHEVMHQWGNFVLEPHPHWGFSSVNGQLGGFDIEQLVDLGEGRYTVGHRAQSIKGMDGIPYSPLELYLAGFVPAEDVPDWIVGVDARLSYTADGMVEVHEDGAEVFKVKEFKTYSIYDIIELHGHRVPDHSVSQKEFRAAVILLIDENHAATYERLEEISREVSRFSYPGDDEDSRYNFYEATRGRGTMLMGNLSEFLIDVEAE